MPVRPYTRGSVKRARSRIYLAGMRRTRTRWLAREASTRHGSQIRSRAARLLCSGQERSCDIRMQGCNWRLILSRRAARRVRLREGKRERERERLDSRPHPRALENGRKALRARESEKFKSPEESTEMSHCAYISSGARSLR